MPQGDGGGTTMATVLEDTLVCVCVCVCISSMNQKHWSESKVTSVKQCFTQSLPCEAALPNKWHTSDKIAVVMHFAGWLLHTDTHKHVGWTSPCIINKDEETLFLVGGVLFVLLNKIPDGTHSEMFQGWHFALLRPSSRFFTATHWNLRQRKQVKR